MYTRNLTVREFYTSIPSTLRITQFFVEGVVTKNDRMATSAMEELLRRGDSDTVVYLLGEFIQHDTITKDDAVGTMIVSALADNEHDAVLRHYGTEMLRALQLITPIRWAEMSTSGYERARRSGVVLHARPWARQFFSFLGDDEVENSRRIYREYCWFTATALRGEGREPIDPTHDWVVQHIDPSPWMVK